MAAWGYEISLLVLKKYFMSEHSKRVKYFSTLKEKFRISVRPCNILHCFVSHRVQYCIMKSLVVVCYQPTCDIASAMILH